ncbi:hypothetical protein [Thiosulfatihalobacter marinus]|uniref:hypothetical protein n=1 Tax=Thiosulfatihalobacter marinus TaxID=2792481 RepID=UPI0018D804DF|nr:hypothetical protein [Thiosulfatihalobacter marinus]
MIELQSDDVVVIRAFDDIPEHLFRISEVYEDCVGGYSLTGPLAGEYGEPEFELILRIVPNANPEELS